MRKLGKVKTSISMTDTTDRIILLFWGASDDVRFQNVMRVDGHGNAIWRAELPTDVANDCFVQLRRHDEEIIATTYSGAVVRLNTDGKRIPAAEAA